MTAATAAQTATILRVGATVLYQGSRTSHRGLLFNVSWAGKAAGGSPVRYDLAYYGDDDVEPRTVLSNVRRESLVHIPAKQVRTRKCRSCGIHYTQVTGHGINTDGCPLCALPEVTGF